MMQNLFWANEKYLWLLGLVPVLLILVFVMARFYRRAYRSLGRQGVIDDLMPEARRAKKVWKVLLLVFALAFLVIALARPQIGAEKSTRRVKASEIVMVVDVSNSMLARPKPGAMSRLDKVKIAANYMISLMKADRVALVIFAGDAAMVMPMSDDYDALRMYLNNLTTTYVSSQGTAIGQALDMAIDAFTDSKDVNKAIVLFSDGENLEGKVDDQIKRAKEEKIRIYTAGVGAKRGNPIFLPGGQTLEYHGQVVISKQDDQFLKHLAAATRGIYVNIDKKQAGIEAIYQDIEKHATGKVASFSRYEDIFEYFVGIALILLLLEIIMTERKNRLMQKIKLFEK